MPPKTFQDTVQHHLRWCQDAPALPSAADEPPMPAAPPTSPIAPRDSAVSRLHGSSSPGLAAEKVRGRRSQGLTMPRICSHDIRRIVSTDLLAPQQQQPQHHQQQVPQPLKLQSPEKPRQRLGACGRGRNSLRSSNVAPAAPPAPSMEKVPSPPQAVAAKLESEPLRRQLLAKAANSMSMPALAPLVAAGAAPPSYPKLLGGLSGQQQKAL